MRVKNHYLFFDDGSQVTYDETPNLSGTIQQMYLIVHYTAGTSLDGTVSWFKNKNAWASSHLVIGSDGSIIQMARFNREAWHAGKSRWGELEGMNKYCIGIEIVNAGKLNRRADGKWISWANQVIPDNEVVELLHKHENHSSGWHIFPEKQIDVAIQAAQALNEKYSFVDILGHDDISPSRKVDPGPAFPMIGFRSKVLGREKS